jgi:subtilisin family serine protease
MCWTCKILPVKVLDSDGSGSMSDVASGIVWAVNNGADIINLSLGGPSNDPVVTDALNYAFGADVLVVASAGNDGTTELNYPAASPGVLSVTGTNITTRTLYPWAQRGATWVDVAAPGCNVVFDTQPRDFCGTSSASPLVAGLAGLLRSIRPSASRTMVTTAIATTADFAPTSGRGDPQRRFGPDATASRHHPADDLDVGVHRLLPGIGLGPHRRSGRPARVRR